jgi:type I restriction enzyme R subunit
VRDDIEALVLDAEVLDSILKDANPAKKAREVEIQLIARLRKHAGNPKFKELGERLEKIRERHEQGLLNSLEFLKASSNSPRKPWRPKSRSNPRRSRIAPCPP